MGKLQALSGAASVVQNRCGNPCHTVLGSIELYRRAQCRGGKIDRELKSRPHLRVRPAVGGDDGNCSRMPSDQAKCCSQGVRDHSVTTTRLQPLRVSRNRIAGNP